MCGESRTHGVKRGKIRSDCCPSIGAAKAADYLSLSQRSTVQPHHFEAGCRDTEPLAGGGVHRPGQRGQKYWHLHHRHRRHRNCHRADPQCHHIVVAESKAPAGYVLDETPQNIVVRSGVANSLIFDDEPGTTLVIRKYIEGTDNCQRQ